METITEKSIREMVVKNVLRVLKNHRVYYIFRCFINSNTQHKNLYLQLPLKSTEKCRIKALSCRGDNPFSSVWTLRGIIKTLETFNINFTEPLSVEDPKTIQHMILNYVNNLLHYCVERGVKDMTIMETLGRESFEMCCKQIFGDDFVDEMKAEPMPPMGQELELSNPFLNEIFNNRFRTRSIQIPPEFRDWLETRNINAPEEYFTTARAVLDDNDVEFPF